MLFALIASPAGLFAQEAESDSPEEFYHSLPILVPDQEDREPETLNDQVWTITLDVPTVTETDTVTVSYKDDHGVWSQMKAETPSEAGRSVHDKATQIAKDLNEASAKKGNPIEAKVNWLGDGVDIRAAKNHRITFVKFSNKTAQPDNNTKHEKEGKDLGEGNAADAGWAVKDLDSAWLRLSGKVSGLTQGLESSICRFGAGNHEFNLDLVAFETPEEMVKAIQGLYEVLGFKAWTAKDSSEGFWVIVNVPEGTEIHFGNSDKGLLQEMTLADLPADLREGEVIYTARDVWIAVDK